MMNKVVLITGAAQGIGKAIAWELAKHQYDIVINYHTSRQAAADLFCRRRRANRRSAAFRRARLRKRSRRVGCIVALQHC